MRILSLDGGGYLGLATAAFLKEAERHFRTTCHERFDLFCGTSTGAIIALALASGMTAGAVEDLYRDFGPKVFCNAFPCARALRVLRGFLMSRYSNRALKKALQDTFGALTLGDLRSREKFVLIPAFSITNGTPRIFKTNHAPHLTRDDGYLVCDVALASSAAPVYLPIVQLRSPTNGYEERYCDGGVFANYPALIAYAEAIYHLHVQPCEIQILSVSTPRAKLAEHESPVGLLQRFLLSRGVLGWGTKVGSMFIDATSGIADQTLRRLVVPSHGSGVLYQRIVLHRPPSVAMDIATPQATEILQRIGAERATAEETRQQLQPFFEDVGD
jgi:hypothetical protein